MKSKIELAGWHPAKLTFVTTAATLLSSLSSLDCEFISINIGFNPANSIFDESEDSIGIGLWNFRSPNKPDECLLYSSSAQYGVTIEDLSYQTPYFNDDAKWNVARTSAFLSVIFGSLVAFIMWFYMIVPSSNHSKYLVFIPVTFALILESCKIFFFFQNHLCTTPMWELLDPISIVRVSNGENIDMPNTDPNTSPSLDHFHVASTCSLNRASYASIACLSLYFFAFILVLYHIWTTHKQQRRFERLSTIQNGNVGSFYSYHTSKTGRTKQSTSEPYIDPRRLSVSALTLDTCHQSESMNSLNHFDERHRKSSRSFKQYDRSGMSRQSSLLSSSSEKTRKKDNSKSSLMRSTDQFSLSSISSDLKSTGTRGGGGKSSSQRFHDSRKEPRWGSTSGAPIRNDRSSTPGQLPITYYTLGHDYRQTSKSSSRLERTPSRPKSARQVSNANHSRRVMSRAASIAALPRNK